MRKAFTLMELIFVIAIVGIIATIGTDIFLRMFSTYYESRTQNELQAKTALALDQIANRLTYRIKPSVIIGNIAANSFTSIESGTATAANQTYSLEWIAYDNDSLRGMANEANSTYLTPGWSGFIDLYNSGTSGTQLRSPGGNFTSVATIVSSLSDGDIDFTDSTAGYNSVALIYPDAQGNVNQYGWYGSDKNLTHPVYRIDDNTLGATVGDFRGISNEVFENYQLAFSAYALEYNPTTKNLTLYYNYQPWNGELYSNGNSSIILEDVTNFIFKQVGSILKLQLCVGTSDAFNAATSDTTGYSFCKEKAIF